MQLKNINNEYIDADIVRYFKLNEVEYLIYSLGETDEAGYVRLYASKIIDDKACIISDADEWQNITQLIKETVRNNRDGNELGIDDLNENKLYDIVLQDTRIFKLQGNLVTLLSENKNVKEIEPEVEVEEEIEDSYDEIIEENIDYEEMYKQQLERNEILHNQITELETKMQRYESKFESIKEIIEAINE